MAVSTLAQDIAHASRVVEVDSCRCAMTGEAVVRGRIATGVTGAAIPISSAVLYRKAMSRHGAGTPSGGRVATRAFIASEVVGSVMAIAANVVEASEVRPPVTIEAVGLGVTARQSHRMYGELRSVPVANGGMAVAAAERSGNIVGTNVAAAAIL
jgi:hypothetical protein